MTATAAVRALLIFILCLSVLLPHLCYAGKRPRGGRRADASPERVEAASSTATDQRPRVGGSHATDAIVNDGTRPNVINNETKPTRP